jgi:hypothetical protein
MDKGEQALVTYFYFYLYLGVYMFRIEKKFLKLKNIS